LLKLDNFRVNQDFVFEFSFLNLAACLTAELEPVYAIDVIG